MDRVRLGRVLGRGARLAARTVYEAVDAATATDPQPLAGAPAQPDRRPRSAVPEILRPSQTAGTQPATAPGYATGQRTVRPSVEAPRDLSRRRAGSSAAFVGGGRAALHPLKQASKAVSLQVSGGFFALFAFAFAVGASRLVTGIAGGSTAVYRLSACSLMAALFTYFAISNFVRASRL